VKKIQSQTQGTPSLSLLRVEGKKVNVKSKDRTIPAVSQLSGKSRRKITTDGSTSFQTKLRFINSSRVGEEWGEATVLLSSPLGPFRGAVRVGLVSQGLGTTKSSEYREACLGLLGKALPEAGIKLEILPSLTPDRPRREGAATVPRVMREREAWGSRKTWERNFS